MPAGLRWFDIGTAAAIGGLSLIDPAPLRPGARAIYRGAIAVLTGVYTWDAMSPREPARRSGPAGASTPDDDDGEFGPYGEFGAHTPFVPTGRRGGARSEPSGGHDLQVRAAYTVGAAGLALGLAGAGEALDGLIQHRLQRAGVSRPRRVLAGAAVAVSLGSAIVDRRAR